MSQTFPINDFKWVEDISEFNQSFIESYNEENNIFLMLMFNILKNCMTFTMIYHFYLKD